MFVTRTLQAETVPDLLPVCQHIGFIRADLWRRYGALANIGKNVSEIRAEIVERGYYNHIPIDGTIRNETIKDVVNDILLYKAAAKQKVRQDIAARTADPEERKRLYTLLKNDAWLSDSFLHRRMRKRFKHGVSQVRNQLVVRSDRHTEEVIDGRLVITIKIAKKYGNDIRLVTTTNGKDVDLTGSNLRILVKGDVTEIHSAYEKPAGRPHGEQALGIDKGYSEAFVDSDGEAHGETFGRILTDYSDRVAATGQGRNQLHALEKKHRAAGHTAKADRIKNHNLGRKKLLARRDRTRRQLRNVAYQSAHAVVDKAALVVSEDLTAPIAPKDPWRRFNRRMSSWAKGVLAEALDSVCAQRNANHVLVNGAYTSQMDSPTGLLKGKRVGDKFYRENGDVMQADHNAALNVLARLDDPEIKRFTPYQEVKRILLARSSGGTDRQQA